MGKHQKKSILYIAPATSSFVRNDITILSENYNVMASFCPWKKKHLLPILLVRQFFLLLKKIKKIKCIIISFGGYWSLFPALLGKVFKIPVFIILNGTDSASIPMLNYGSLRKQPLRWFCKKSYQYASKLLPVSDSLVSIKNIFLPEDNYSFQGYKHFFPSINTPFEVVFNGLDESFWKIENDLVKEENSFISVFSSSQFELKGGDLIIKIAQKHPALTFYLAGLDKPSHLFDEKMENVFFLGKLSPIKLREYYNKSQFVFQLSIFEGFGCALAEAMLCKCIPIGSAVNIIPTIIGDSGYILSSKSESELELLLNKVINSKNRKELGKKARNRIVENFSLKQRKEHLIKLIEGN